MAERLSARIHIYQDGVKSLLTKSAKNETTKITKRR